MASPIWIALLRGIGPSTHGVMPMAALRKAATDAGLSDVQTVLATGNVIFQSALPAPEIQNLFDGIVAGFDLQNDVFLRQPADLVAARDANPFPDAADTRPNHLLIHFFDEKVPDDALADYEGPERIAISDRVLFIDYANGVGTSRLTPTRLQRGLGQSGTARNWNTLGKLIAKTT